MLKQSAEPGSLLEATVESIFAEMEMGGPYQEPKTLAETDVASTSLEPEERHATTEPNDIGRVMQSQPQLVTY